MNNTSIRAKLTLAFGGLTLIVFLMVAFALTTSSNANQEFQSFVQGVNARTLASHQLREAVDQRAVSARNIVLADNPLDRERERQTVGKAHTDVQTHLAQLNQLALGSDVSQEAKQLIQEIDRIERSYAPVALDIVDLGLKGQTAEAIRKINEKCRPLLAALVQASEQYNEYSAKHAQELLATASANYENQRNLLIAASLAVLATAIAAGVLITRAVTQPIAQAVAVAQAVASGDLASPIPTHRKDEVGQLLAAMHTMQQGLVRVVASVRQGSEGVANASAEIAQGNHDLSARTEGQASALQQTAASMEQLSATVRNNSDSAVRANELADGASHIARHGGEAVGEVVSTMKDIAHSSQKIADIISVIDGIAFQTNILALNAAVEAARAGEQGRGFAVVATEVRSLAGRSAQAAKEIKQLIHTSLETVERGTRMADTAGGRMGEIVGSIEKVASLIAEISAASREQALGVGQIGEAITQMDQTTQQNAALVEEMAAAASSLKTQSQDLVEVVAEFKLDADNSPRATTPRLAKSAPAPLQLMHRYA